MAHKRHVRLPSLSRISRRHGFPIQLHSPFMHMRRGMGRAMGWKTLQTSPASCWREAFGGRRHSMTAKMPALERYRRMNVLTAFTHFVRAASMMPSCTAKSQPQLRKGHAISHQWHNERRAAPWTSVLPWGGPICPIISLRAGRTMTSLHRYDDMQQSVIYHYGIIMLLPFSCSFHLSQLRERSQNSNGACLKIRQQ